MIKPTHRAFILCRPRDIDIARACRDHMAGRHGWRAHILIDPREWEAPPEDTLPAHYSTQNRGMFGNECAAAILDGILAHSHPGDRCIKMDCDVFLTTAASEWLATGPEARAYKITYRDVMPWGGIWSADHAHIAEARQHADTLKRCRCPESQLNLRCLRATGAGITLHPADQVTQWTPGEDPGTIATLPITRRTNRTTEALALFAQPAK